jgi:hypothetical protein
LEYPIKEIPLNEVRVLYKARAADLDKETETQIKTRMARKAQNSIEYLSIVGIAMLMLVPATLLFLNYTKTTNDQVVSSQLNLLGNTLVQKGEEMYVLGKGSWVTLELSMPEKLNSANITGETDLVLTYSSANGVSQAVFFIERFKIGKNGVDCSVSCDLKFRPGLNKIKIEYNGSRVVYNIQ